MTHSFKSLLSPWKLRASVIPEFPRPPGVRSAYLSLRSLFYVLSILPAFQEPRGIHAAALCAPPIVCLNESYPCPPAPLTRAEQDRRAQSSVQPSVEPQRGALVPAGRRGEVARRLQVPFIPPPGTAPTSCC
ncbi:hypothetical protein SKAU_G00201250 [Synaphobranchus kaupii]|uniref:Uncharacterized protein n=1 Tax=Synaphobranchus kaupii TaxID=118154 RepID=A0A9Q1FFF9_SYNKA|nr:hypothetical protein SKAU_G00201250 [Synaphobranchus kaupii]